MNSSKDTLEILAQALEIVQKFQNSPHVYQDWYRHTILEFMVHANVMEQKVQSGSAIWGGGIDTWQFLEDGMNKTTALFQGEVVNEDMDSYLVLLQDILVEMAGGSNA
jgi:hypothetical protein